MPQSFCVLSAHIIFSTKERRPWLNKEIRPRLWAYMSRILQNLECTSITAGGIEDHVHILANLTRKHPPMKVLEILRGTVFVGLKWLKGLACPLRARGVYAGVFRGRCPGVALGYYGSGLWPGVPSTIAMVQTLVGGLIKCAPWFSAF